MTHIVTGLLISKRETNAQQESMQLWELLPLHNSVLSRPPELEGLQIAGLPSSGLSHPTPQSMWQLQATQWAHIS